MAITSETDLGDAEAGSAAGGDGFPLSVPLAGGDLDRCDQLRRDPAALAAMRRDPSAGTVILKDGKPAIALVAGGGARLFLAAAGSPLAEADPDPIFLGRSHGAPRFAADAASLDGTALEAALAAGAGGAGAEVKFIDIRSIGPNLTPSEAGMVAAARSLTEWRRTHLFCARCGAPTVQAQGGWRRDCPACGAKHFPRTDPVVIMLVTRPPSEGREEEVLIGRQPGWPEGMHSLLAGYIEPGETVEAAVRRETREEAGVIVGRVRYLASQPWPFPSTLMIGCWAEARSFELEVDAHELETAFWISRSEMRRALAGAHPTVSAPRVDAIARVLIEAWAEERLDPVD